MLYHPKSGYSQIAITGMSFRVERVVFYEIKRKNTTYQLEVNMSSKTVFFKLMFPEVDPNFPTNPEVEIHARHDGTYKRMTPKITEPEFDGYIDHLEDELEHIRREGKRKFAAAKNKLRA